LGKLKAGIALRYSQVTIMRSGGVGHWPVVTWGLVMPPELKVMLSAKEVAKLVGKSAWTVRRWGISGEHDFPAPTLRAGHPRWRRLQVESWVEQQQVRR
jgi:predicted DNA-binding transcriptional regulator AlpA